MIKVFLRLEGHPSHDTVREYFTSVNAPLAELDPALQPEALRAGESGLFVVAEEYATPQLLYFLNEHLVIVISDTGSPGEVSSSPGKSKHAKAVWPVGREDFLRLSAEMSRLSERRLFSAIVRIFSTDAQNVYMGQSIDFSGSGMAFRTREDFRVGEELSVSLSLPGGSDRLELPVKVTRIVERRGDGDRIYGARFSGIDEPTRSSLERFISGG